MKMHFFSLAATLVLLSMSHLIRGQVRPGLIPPSSIKPKFYVSTSKGSAEKSGLAQESNASKNLTAVLSVTPAGSTILLCQGDVFQGPFNITKDNITIGSYICSQSSRGKQPLITVADMIKDRPQTVTLANGALALVYNLTEYTSATKQDVWSVWDGNDRYITARFPNLLNPRLLNGTSRREFIFLNSSTATTITPSSDLKLYNTSYWENATVRLRTWQSAYVPYRILSVNLTDSSWAVANSNFLPLSATMGMNGFFLEHGISELDAPGEFFFDMNSQLLYIIPISNDTLQAASTMANGTSDSNRPGIAVLLGIKRIVEGTSGPAAALTIRGNNTILKDVHLAYNFDAILANGKSLYVANTTFRNSFGTGITCAASGSTVVVRNVTMSDTSASAAIVLTPTCSFDISGSLFRQINAVAGYGASTVISAVFAAPMVVRSSTIEEVGGGVFTLYSNSLVEDCTIREGSTALSDSNPFELIAARITNVTIRGNTLLGALRGNMNSMSSTIAVMAKAIETASCSSNIVIQNNVFDVDSRFIATYSGITLVFTATFLSMFDSVITNNTFIGSTLISLRNRQDSVASNNCAMTNVTLAANTFRPAEGQPAPSAYISFWVSTPPWLSFAQALSNFTLNDFRRDRGSSLASWVPVSGVAGISMAGNFLSHDL